MFSTHRLMLSCFYLVVLLSVSLAIEDAPTDIEEDVIKIQNETQKVIRVHPHDLPPKKDNTGNQMNSALFQIQTLRPGSAGVSSTGSPRQYVDSKQMRKRRPRPAKLLREDVVASETEAAEGAQVRS
ncbi:uncharacterized protein [Drosophila bipectinata]|uniref:uncharacterized protein isoform X2 n=1 Tax=Drosophila bipectinata TaxID=42026 RepID=UPI0007E8A8E3|nr:uncharacterized protein LOC108123041 isoform X2 [Drosophila bipectinata]